MFRGAAKPQNTEQRRALAPIEWLEEWVSDPQKKSLPTPQEVGLE